jgi:hypothetical protein
MVENTEPESALDAVNAALGEAMSPEHETPEPEVETEGAEVETEGEAAEETDAEAEARGAERNPDGTFKKKEAVKEADVEKKEPLKKEPPKKDHVNDPIPENLKKDTSERIRSLIDTTKTVTAERDKLKTDYDYMIRGVEATGTTPAQYGETLSWLSLFNSHDPAQQAKALELVENVAERLATLLGKERTVGDPLKAHADLAEAVRTGKLTADYAKEIARTRNGQQFRTELTTNATREQEQQNAAKQELHTARLALSELEKTLMDSDPSYAAKKAILVPALRPVFAVLSPSQWVPKFKEAYRNIKVNAPAAKSIGAPVNQPLRAGKQPAGGQTKAPGSMLEAISGALGSMGK